MTKTQPLIICGHCRRTFERPKPTGRLPRYCTSKCRSASYRTRTGAPAELRDYDDDVVRISHSLLTRAQGLDHSARHRVPALPLEVVEWCVALRRDLEDVTAVAVRQARTSGATWTQISRVMTTAESTLKANYSAEKTDKILAHRADRRPARKQQRPVTAQNARNPPGRRPNRLLPGQPGYALSCALSYLGRNGDLDIRSLALSTGVSTSYIYRIMSGERTPVWDVTRAFAHACGADPEDVMFLWNAAQGLSTLPPADGQTRAQAVRALQAALRGLRLAAAQPGIPALVRRGPMPLTGSAAASLLAAEAPPAGFLRWPVVEALTTALQGDADAIRPLWARIEELTATGAPDEGHGPPAAAFG